MGEFEASLIFETEEDIVVFGDCLNLAPELEFIEVGVGFHEADMGELQLESG